MKDHWLCRTFGHAMTTFPTHETPDHEPTEDLKMDFERGLYETRTTEIPLIPTFLACERCGFRRG